MNRRPWDTLLYYAPVYTRTGYGTISRAYIRALHEAGLPIVVRSIGWTDPGIPPEDAALLQKLESAPVVGSVAAIFHATPSEWAAFTPIPDLVQRINVSLFETDRAPAEWVPFLNQFDQIWTPTEFHRDAYVRSGVRPELFRIIPFTHPWIDAPQFTPVERRDGAFRFLNISEFTPRKRLDVLLSAFFEEFTSADAAQFYLKISYPKWMDAELAARTRREFFNLLLEIEKRYPQRAPLIVDETLGTPEALRALTLSADTYVSADCAGYTLPVIETMACGRVAVTVDWCGGADLVLSDFGYRIPVSAQTVPIPESVWSVQPLYRDHQWTDLRVEDVRRILRDAYERAPEERRQMGEAAREFCRQNMSGQAIAAQMVEALSFQAAAQLPQPEAARARGAPLPAAKPETPQAQAEAGPGTPAAWPDEVIEHLQQADAHFAAGDLEAAREALSHALDLAPDDPQLIIAYGNVLLRLGDLDAARKEFVKAAVLHPDYAPAHVNLAAVLWHLGQSAEAEASLRRALALNPEDAESLKLLGHMCLDAERFEEAVKAFAEVLRWNPDDLDALLILGKCYFEVGRLDSAQLMYERALAVDPGNAAAAENLAVVKSQRAGVSESPAALEGQPVIGQPPSGNGRKLAVAGAAAQPARPRRPFTIGVDARTLCYSSSVARGIGHYTLSHLSALVEQTPDWQYLLLLEESTQNEALARLTRFPNVQVRAYDDADAFGIDLFHIPDPMGIYVGFDSPFRVMIGTPVSMVFYDLIPLVMQDTYLDKWDEAGQVAYRARLRQVQQSGGLIFAISENTRDDLHKHLGLPPEQLTVIMAGPNKSAEPGRRSSAEVDATLRKYGIKPPFFLNVGALDPHKSFSTSVEAHLMTQAGTAAQLVVAGDLDSLKQVHKAEIKKRKIPDIVFTGFVTREELEDLYSAATALLFPSKYEGFGFPVLEAMACGCPVITCNVASIPEVAGEAALLVPPGSRHVAAAMLTLLHEPKTREEMIQKGQAQAAKFKWEDTARKTIEAIQRKFPQAGEVSRGIPLPQPVAESPQEAAPPSKSPAMVWRAPLFDPSGYADEARHFLLQLSAQGIEIAARPAGRHSDSFRSRLDGGTRRTLDALLAKAAPSSFVSVQHFPAYAFERNPQAAYNIGRVMFETDGLPTEWVAKCNQMDEIWVPTDFNLETFRRAGVTAKLIKVPGGIDTARFRPGLKPLRIPGARGTVFLSIFEWQDRKGWDVLLRAWAEAFRPGGDVSLVLRTCPLNAVDSPNAAAEIENRLNRFLQETLGKSREQVAPIVVLGEQIPEPRLPRLFAAADVYVAPSRGEGWGRPQMQAMACGLPVIATRWSGNLEFMNDDNSYLIDVEGLTAIDDRAEIPFYRGSRWAEPSTSHLVALMRHVHENRAEAAALGQRARQDVIEHWTWERAAQTIVERLEVISRQWAVSGFQSAVGSGQSADGGRDPSAISDKPREAAIRWEGSQFVHHSLALINREVCIQLAQNKDFALSIIPYEPHQFDATSDPRFAHIVRHLNKPLSKPADVHVRHQWPPNFTPPPEGHWVMIQPWEFGSLPKKWIEIMRAQVDEVWVPGSFVRECYIQSGLPADRVHVVPNGVDVSKFRPDAPPMKLKTDKRFQFLFVGGTIWRKGPDVLLDAYLKSFTADDEVCLVVKDMGGDSFYKGMTFADQIRQAQSDPRAPEILYLSDDLSPADLPGLYTACDCLVQPYRGEGFGLPIAEAMACGLPAIVTSAGACLDFCDESTAYLIPAEKQYFTEKRIGQWETSGLPFIYEPDGGVAAELMRRVFENRDEARAIGARASGHIRENLTWERSAARVMERIRALRERPIIRFASSQNVAGSGDFRSLGDFGSLTADPAAQEMLAKGEAAISAGKWDEAESVFAMMVCEFPDRADAHAGLGSALLVRGQAARAAEVLARAVELAPRDADLGNQLGVALFQSGDLKSAESIFQKSLSLAPDNVDSILNLVEVHRAQGQYPEAARHVKRAIQLAPQDPNVLTAFGTLSAELGDSEAARIALDNLRRVAPDHPAVRMLEETLVTV